MNKKGFMRTLEAFISATIMIVAISFMISEEKISYTGAPTSEIIEGKNYLYDVLAVMENSEIHGEGKLSYYISNRDPYSLQRDLENYITKDYTYEMDVYKIESIVVDTSNTAVDYDTDNDGLLDGTLTNGYKIATSGYSPPSEMNYNNVWHYAEFDLLFPINMLVVDHDPNPGYDTIYLNLENDTDYTSTSTFVFNGYSWSITSRIGLEVGDTFTIKKEVANEYTINYKYIVNSISPDGNSVAFSLMEADMVLYTLPYEIDIFDWTVRFSYVNNSLTVELNDNGNYRVLDQGLRKGDFLNVNSYTGYIDLVRSDYLSIEFYGYKQQIMELRRGGKVYTAVSARRIINVKEGNDLNIYYVYLIRGRGEVE